jgi:deoxyribodipyrimidine photolyase-related protein
MRDSPSGELSRHSRIRSARRLLFVLGDQLDPAGPALDELDKERDAVLMVEVKEEAEVPPSHRQRTTLFLSAMRHYALDRIEEGHRVRYVRLDDRANTGSLRSELERAIGTLDPECVRVVQPGDHRVAAAIRGATDRSGVGLDVLPDTTFTCSLEEFDAWADDGRKELTMEHFYRQRRRALNVLIDDDGKPVGGRWNFDRENRETFKEAPEVPRPYMARPDDVTREVMDLVETTWPDAYGRLDHFRWPVTRTEARRALDRFIEERLERFGTYEDAMWAGEPVLYHSQLSSSLNLALLTPSECVAAAVEAFEEGRAEINNVEGFVRQLIGWREFIRGVYFHEGPDYLRRNGLDQHGDLPPFFWTADTDMRCMSHSLNGVLDHAWGHHIPRLMVIGNFALMAGVRPKTVHNWFLGMYVDAVDWVTAPNVIGMSQHADGGVVGTKPYVSSGKYIDRMSNYCRECRYDVNERVGDDACPFNALYWDFLIRNRDRLADTRRMGIALSNVDKLGDGARKEIDTRARRLRDEWDVGPISP